MTRAAFVLLLGIVVLLFACAPRAPQPAIAPRSVEIEPSAEEIDREVQERLAKRVDLDVWRSFAGGAGGAVGVGGASYLAPRGAFVAEDGGVDVIVHFNAAQLADAEWRRSGANAVIVSAAYGQLGTNWYRDAFADPNRFGTMMKDLLRRVNATYVRRLALVSWSAGYAATDMILREPRYYAMVDTVILLDSLHAAYTNAKPAAPPREVDTSTLGTFFRFARDAAEGKKTMIVTHSSIIPPDYASTTETAALLCEAAGAPRTFEPRAGRRGMVERYHADRGNLHVRGFAGGAAKDHMDQLFIVGDLAREHIVPRWARLDAIDRLTAPRGVALSSGRPVR